MNEIKDLNEQIHKLNCQKAEILRQQEADAVEEFKTLKWIKECSARLDIHAVLASGIDRYTLHLFGPVPNFEHNNILPIYPGITFINYNQGFVMSTFSFGYGNSKSPKIVTSNTDALIRFLQEHKFKSLTFNEEDAKLYYFLHCMEK